MRILFLAALAPWLFGQSIPAVKDLKLVLVKAESVTFKGRAALRVSDAGPAGEAAEGRFAILPGAALQNGVIELELAGEPGPGASGQARGFVGVAFRLSSDAQRFECFYLRPTNGRAEDQVRRNHSAQYISIPGFPWQMLRQKFPEMYESYVDLVPADWTRVRIEVNGLKARLYVHGNQQPTLIVNELKQPAAAGAIGLWVGPGTVAHFAGIKVTPQ